MKFFFLGKAALPLLAATLLLLHPFAITPFPPARGSAEKASQHRCGCTVEEAASGACGCAARRCCTCCSGPGEKTALPSCHPSPKDSSVISIRVCPCGGPADFGIHASGIKFILTDFTVASVVNSALFPEETHKKPGSPSLKPSVPPPEITAPFLTA